MRDVNTSYTTGAVGRPDAALAAAVDVALEAARAEAGPHGRVGAYLGARPAVASAGAKAVTHAFACEEPGYVGWYWEVELSRAPRSKQATVDDVALLPGEEAVRAPEWVPWSERLRPGDVGPGDLLPTAADDPRLVLRQADTEGWVDDELWLELGLGRARVLSAEGRDLAAERWYAGQAGPDSDTARAAPKPCGSCGFYVGLVGALGRVFGVCTNEWASDDGRAVAMTHGCGAHSEAMVLPSATPSPLELDDESVETTRLRGVPIAEHPPGSVDDTDPDEPGGHS